MALQLRPLLQQLTIQTKKLHVVKFPVGEVIDSEYSEFPWAQNVFLDTVETQYNAGKPVRVIVLKARQLGMSSVAAGIIYNWAFLHPGMNGLIVAHEVGPAENLFQKVKLFWETWPFKQYYDVKYATRHQLQWLPPIRSNIQVASAKNLQSGRGSTLHAVQLSEFAFYPNPGELMTGLNQTITNTHGTVVIIESTANGIGNMFHEMWNEAESGRSDYTPLFFPWWKHYEYKWPTTLSTKLELSPYERWLLKLGASYTNIQWRRWAMQNLANNDEQAFMQEYPSTPDEAFISTGQPVFPHQRLQECYEPQLGFTGMLVEHTDTGKIEFVQDRSGFLTIYKAPTKKDRRSDRYFIAGDPTMAVAGDYGCIQVLNRRTMEQVAVWHGRVHPMEFGKEMMLIGRYYHDAMLCPEVEGGGQATIAIIMNANYPNVWQHQWPDKAPGKVTNAYGWSTNYNRKQLAVGTLKSLMVERSITLHDKTTYNQLRNYVIRANGDMGNADAATYDDSVMALAICVTASRFEGPFSESRSSDHPMVDIFNDELESGLYDNMLGVMN